MIVTEVKGHIESKQIFKTIVVKIKWHFQIKEVENRVDLYHDSERDERRHIESKHFCYNNE